MKSQKGRPHPDKEVGFSLRYQFLLSHVLQRIVFISICFVQVSIFSFQWHSLSSCCMLGSSDRIQNIGSTKSFSTRSTKVHLAFSLKYLVNTLLHLKSKQIYTHPTSLLPGGTENSSTTKIARTFQVDVPEGSGDDGKAAEGYKKVLGSMFDSMVPLKKGKKAESDSDDEKGSRRRRRNNSDTAASTTTKDPKAGF